MNKVVERFDDEYQMIVKGFRVYEGGVKAGCTDGAEGTRLVCGTRKSEEVDDSSVAQTVPGFASVPSVSSDRSASMPNLAKPTGWLDSRDSSEALATPKKKEGTGSAVLGRIQGFVNRASEARYLATQSAEVILATLIMQVMAELSGNTDATGPEFFDNLAYAKDLTLEKALVGFEFFDNNPLKKKAEKRLAKLMKKRKKAL